jgi:hypothetical protein
MDLGGHDKEDIEDLTGKIPLLLDQCVVNGKINLDPLASVGAKAAIFTDQTRKEVGNSGYWNLYGPPYLLSLHWHNMRLNL